MSDLSEAEQAFVEEVIEISRKHGLSISHEDSHGAFQIDEYDDGYSNWLRAAYRYRPRDWEQ